MSNTKLMTVIQKKFEDNTSYSNPIHAVNQADSIAALSVDLYTDSNRFIYELLQNADDSSCNVNGSKVWIKVFNNELVVAHSGKVFDGKDIQGICNINHGTKKTDLTKTGYKGIGFKSVFGQSNYVVIYTGGEFFRFDSSYNFKWSWDKSQKDWEIENNRRFQQPWQIIPIPTETLEVREEIRSFISEMGANVATILKMNHIEETREAIQKLSQNTNMFLFLKNITEIHFENTSITVDRSNPNRIILNKGKMSEKEWLIKNINLNVSKEFKRILLEERHIPSKLLDADFIEMTFAAQIDNTGIVSLEKKDRVLYSYLPTGETKYELPVLVNTNFLISASRESIHKDSKWNQWLFECISFEIFKWISELVISEISFEAYKLIPEKSKFDDDLAEFYNRGIKKATEEIAFILARNNTRIKISEALIDFTHLSEKNFIGEEPIKKFIIKQSSYTTTKFYVKQCVFWSKLKKIGVSIFGWKEFGAFLNSIYFKETHSIQKNIELIKFLRLCCKSEKFKEVTNEYVCNLPFIWDHKNQINYPKQVCFPTADDENWDNVENELSFVHKDILAWLLKDLETKTWLENLGVEEKTDITYITQNILPHVSTYINKENAISEIQKLFLLYRKGDLKEDLIRKLSKIKLMTIGGTLLQASECYLSDFYNPRMKIENLLKNDIFVSEEYYVNPHERGEWKRFFKFFGVSEGTDTLLYNGKNSKEKCVSFGINPKYFDEIISKYSDYSSLSIDSIGNIASINYIHFLEKNEKLAFEFWKDYIKNFLPEEIEKEARAYWGYSGMGGQTSGKIVQNYIPWFIRNTRCIPTLKGDLYTSSEVYLNKKEIKDIAGEYLPIFKGDVLSQGWQTFFKFKTKLDIEDYLNILLQISLDLQDEGSIKNENLERLQLIYSILLDECIYWKDSEIEKVEIWSENNRLLNSKNTFTECNNLYYFIDGNEEIFQDQYAFIKLNAKNKNHPNLKKILECFQVKLLSQSQFKLVCDKKEECVNLKIKLNRIVPYFKSWIENEEIDDNTKKNLLKLQNNINGLEIYESKDVKITYEEMYFMKNVNLHIDENKVYVTKPWNSNSVLLRLAESLCIYFELEGYSNKLDFLLRADDIEIRKYFSQEGIELPPENLIGETNELTTEGFDDNYKKELSEDFHEDSLHHFERKKYIQSLIPRAVDNVLKHLNTLPEYDCTAADVIAESVIGGITKNGNDIKVVARPSDNDKIRLYYDSEFDVLEYVDAEIWYEDGITPPKQFTLGQLLKMTEINKIPIKKINIKDTEFDSPKSEILEFDAIPFSPEKTAKVIASFANTNGGTIIFGIKELSPIKNEIVGLSKDFNVIDITNKAISMLNPTPNVSFDWIKKGEELVFVIETVKADTEILLNKQKFIRQGTSTVVLDDKISKNGLRIKEPKFKRTVAIIISIENYFPKKTNRIPPVKYANNDAEKFKEMLLNKFSMDESDIVILKNEEAIKNEIKDVIKYEIRSMNEDDRLIFYYVGHGFHDGVTNYISTYDMNITEIANTAISLREVLLDPLKHSKCKNALIFIDACAQSFIDPYSRNTISNINTEELMVFSNDSPHYALFLSCQDGESSYSCDNLKNGIWTHYLTKAIIEWVDEVTLNYEYITDRRLGDYLSLYVSQYAKSQYNWNQNPKTILDSSYENIITGVRVDSV